MWLNCIITNKEKNYLIAQINFPYGVTMVNFDTNIYFEFYGWVFLNVFFAEKNNSYVLLCGLKSFHKKLMKILHLESVVLADIFLNIPWHIFTFDENTQ